MDINIWDIIQKSLEKLYNEYKGKRNSYVHYTSIKAFSSIFDEYKKKPGEIVDSCVMHAGQVRFLNDAEEYKSGVKWLREQFETEGHLFNATDENIYSISFCGEKDLLSQWKWYGKDSGIAIDYNIDNIKYHYWNVDGFPGDQKPDCDIHSKPLPICYSDEDKKLFFEATKKVLQEQGYIPSEIPEILSSFFIPFCKNECFTEEAESRQIFYLVDKDLCGDYGMSFDTSYNNDALKPILKVKFCQIDPAKNIINRLIVGPGQDQERIYNALVHMFDSKPFKYDETSRLHECANGVIIEKSKIPFRS